MHEERVETQKRGTSIKHPLGAPLFNTQTLSGPLICMSGFFCSGDLQNFTHSLQAKPAVHPLKNSSRASFFSRAKNAKDSSFSSRIFRSIRLILSHKIGGCKSEAAQRSLGELPSPVLNEPACVSNLAQHGISTSRPLLGMLNLHYSQPICRCLGSADKNGFHTGKTQAEMKEKACLMIHQVQPK